jgi:hypothetical protein
MDPFVSKDGSRHTNRDSMKRADARFGSQQPSRGGMDEEDGGAQDGASMAAEHGPAVEITVQHDHEGGSHTVRARHPDGHEHESEHGSAAEAHRYAADCAGSGDGGM